MRSQGRFFVHCLLIGCALLLVLTALTPSEGAQQALQPGAEVLLRKSYNTSRFVYVELGDQTLVYEHGDSRLFPVVEDLPVRITEVKTDDGELEIKYRHPQLGEGKVTADLRGIGGAQAREAATAIVRSAFVTGGGVDDYKPIVANTRTGVAHFRGANHLPDGDRRLAFEGLEEAGAEGYRPCRVCFFETPRISNYAIEQQLGQSCSAQARYYNAVVVDPERHQRVERLANRVLENWPIPLRGYSYRFWLLESSDVNAIACPGGDIFVHTALMDVIEDDDELEAILAHEIGHVELRHSYRRLRAAQKASFWAGLATVAAAATTAAVTDDPYDASSVAGFTASLSTLTAQIVLSGYGRDLEMESDSMAITYQQSSSRDRDPTAALGQVLRKLRYSSEVRGFDVGSSGNAFSTHPHIEDRIARADTAQAQPMVGTTFVGYDNAGNEVAVLDFILQSVSQTRDGGGLEVLAAIETTTALGDDSQIKDLRVTAGGRQIKLDNKEDTEIWPNDSAGVMLQNEDERAPLGEITALDLNLRNVATWRREERLRDASGPASVTARVATGGAIPVTPLPAGAATPPEAAEPGGLLSPTLINKGAQWTERASGTVGYLWGAEVENPNDVAINALVTLQLLDEAGVVVYAYEYVLPLAAGSTQAFTEEGSVTEEIAARGASWAFQVQIGQ